MARANATYYATHDPFHDFTTAPEIAQMFGELLGAWAAVVWQQMGAPDPVLLIEPGPGRATLMEDALRATARVAPAFRAACRVHFVETSPRLAAVQARLVPDASWHATLADVPAGPAIVLANEFLDALPIRQFERHGGAWCERHVRDGSYVLLPDKGKIGEDPPRTGRHTCRLRPPEPPSPPSLIEPRPQNRRGVWGERLAPPNLSLGFMGQTKSDLPSGDTESAGAIKDGTVAEMNESAITWVQALAARFAEQGGAALILDYGRAQPGYGDTLQALRDGRPADPLADPGQADLTALVDFPALAEAAREAGAMCYGPIAQGALLSSLGLGLRTARLAAANPQRAAALREAADRLAAPARMGQLFKALAITAPGAPVPPGFAA